MKYLKFKQKFLNQICNDEKTQTLRKTCKINIGDEVRTNDEYNKYLLNITSIDTLPVYSLTQEDVEREGFNNLAELIIELKEIYPDLEESSLLYRIQFQKV